MDTLLIGTFAVLGLSGILLEWKRNYRLTGIYHALFAVVALLWMSLQFNEELRYAFYILCGIITFGYVLSQVVPNKWVGAVVSLVAGVGCVLGFNSMTIEFLDLTFVPESKFLILGVVLAAIGPVVGELKFMFFGRLLNMDEDQWMRSVYIFLVAVTAFLGMFSAPGIGAMLIGSTFLLGSFFRKDELGNSGISLITLAVLPILAEGLSSTVNMLSADILEGLLLGVFGMYFVKSLWRSEEPKVLGVAVVYIISIGVLIAVAYAGTQLELMGGMDAYIAAIFGAAIVNTIVGKNYSGTSYLSILLAIGLVLPSMFTSDEKQEAEEQIITISGVDENGETVKPPKSLPLEELNGNYTIRTDSSLVQFRLGEDGVNTGKFKKISGNFHLNEDPEKSSLNVVLSMSDFTTFNRMRDEHLREAEYFNVSKYPEMRFSAKGFKKSGENLFEVQGEFKMLGITKPVKVTLQRIESGENIVLIGSGSLDRTEFGMTPSAAEGNVVDFDYIVQLQK